MKLDEIIAKVRSVVDSHCLDEGSYARWIWNNKSGSRDLGASEYGCADAANILYTIGDFVREPEKRQIWVKNLQYMQNPETGLFSEPTHHTFHTTAHCVSALELFDALPRYPLRGLEPYLDIPNLYALLEGLDWANRPWPQSHQGAGVFAALSVTREADANWTNAYFDWLSSHCDPETGIGIKNRPGEALLCHRLFGWFHYLFNHEYARRPFPYAEKLIDSCIDLYKNKALSPNPNVSFGREIGFVEIDWIFALNRATRQTPHRFYEAKELLLDCGKGFVSYLEGLDEKKDDGMNDLHMLFGAVCALSELQLALPGEFSSTVPLKNPLDRRPFI